MVKNRSKAVALCLAILGTFICLPDKAQVEAEEKLNRSQTMLLNLKTAPESSGYYIVQAHRISKEIIVSLEKALSQLAAVDQSYAKYRKRPDDRFLQVASLKTTLAKQTAQDLQMQLEDAYAQLKTSVEEALITEEQFPLDKNQVNKEKLNKDYKSDKDNKSYKHSESKPKSKNSVPGKVVNFLL
jgi:hypothetical protein